MHLGGLWQDTTEVSDDIVFTEIGSAEDAAAQQKLADSVKSTDSLKKDTGSVVAAATGTDAVAGQDLHKDDQQKTLWETFIQGLLGGFIAFLMPCIFPMVPLTVSYFTKKAARIMITTVTIAAMMLVLKDLVFR